MNRSKCLEYYLDSKLYGSKEIQDSIDKTKKEFLNKNVYVDIYLNDFGMYVVTFYFENKNNYFNKIKFKFKKRNKSKAKIRLEKYYGNNYGQYKSTGIYKPY